MFIRTLTNPESLFLFLAAFFTFILAGFTIALFLDGREKGRKELRAYLGIQEHRVQIVGTTPQVYLRIQNTGETPAKDVRIAIDFERRHISSSDDFPAPKYSEGRRPLAPEAIWEARRVMPEIKQHTHSINRTHRIFVWGLIEYWDIYEKEPRYVRFRFRSDELMMEGIAITGWTLATTEDGNDTT